MTQHHGPQSAGDTLEIMQLTRLQKQIEIRQGLIDGCGKASTILPELRRVVMNSWTGRTTAGDPVHIHYHAGVIVIEVDALTSRGTRSPVVVMRWNPRRALAELSTPVLVSGKKLEAWQLRLHRERLITAAAAEECREARCQIGDAGRMFSEIQMLQWVSDHYRRFDELAALGLAGSKLRFRFVQERVQTSSAA